MRQLFDIEVFPNMLIVCSIFSPIPDVLPLDRPYTLWKRFNKLNIIRRIKNGN